MKTCSKCKETKPFSEFYITRARKDHLDVYCKKCKADLNYKARYGVTTEDVNQMWYAQDGICALCDKELGDKFNVDHDHETNKVRSLLCYGCNVGMGLLGDSIEHLQRAIAYIEEHRLPAREADLGHVCQNYPT